MRVTKSNMRRKRVMADTDIAPEATDLLFEVEEVAELLAEVTGEDVEVEADGDAVSFTVAEEVFECQAEGNEEVVESSTRINKRRVSASTVRRPARRVAASKKIAGKSVRKLRRK